MLYNNTVTHTPLDPVVFLNNLQALKAVRAGHREAVDNLCKWYSSPSQLICNCICSFSLLDREAKKRHLTQTQRQGHKGSNQGGVKGRRKRVRMHERKRMCAWMVGYLVDGSWGTDLWPLLWRYQSPGWRTGRPGQLPPLWPWRVRFQVKQRHRAGVRQLGR